MKNKIFTLLILSLMIFSYGAMAQEYEEGGHLVNVFTEVYDDPDTPAPTAFSFVAKLTDYTVRAKWVSDTISYVPTYLGARCNSGDYVTLLSCSDTAGTSCRRAQSVDYKLESSTDRLDTRPLQSYIWWDSFKSGRYLAYECRVPKTSSTTPSTPSTPSTPDPEDFGYVIDIDGPSRATTGQSVTVTASYKAKVTGSFVFECTFDQLKKTSLSVITSSSSSCDGSQYVAGKKVNGVAGQTYDFKYTFRAPTTPGNYPITCYAWTDCYKNGGEFIDGKYESRIPVESPKTICNYAAAADNMFKATGKVISSWTTTLVSKYGLGCDLSELKNFCGTADQDKDGIPDNCDYCPQGFGAADSPVPGCHPCYGKGPTDTCWDVYEDDFGIPDQIEERRNPIIGTGKKCVGDNLQTCAKRKDGTLEDCKVTSECDYGCDSSKLQCKPKPATVTEPTTEAPTLLRSEYKCGSDNNVHVFQIYSDGSEKDLFSYKTCSYGCEDGGCLKAPADETCSGGQECGTDDTVTTSDPECSSDDNCPPSYMCDGATRLCVPYNPDVTGCNNDDDCSSGEECLAYGQCVQIMDIDCREDSECPDGWCFGGQCYEDTPEVPSGDDFDDTLGDCTDDQTAVCADGTTITTAYCNSLGQLEVLENYCPEWDQENLDQYLSPGEGSSSSSGGKSIIDYFIKSDDDTTTTVSDADSGISPWYIVFGLAIVGAAIAFLPKKKGGKKKKRR